MTSTVTARPRRTRGSSPAVRRPAAGSDPAGDAVDAAGVPVSGIADLADNHGYLRISGYLPEADDVYLSSAQIKRYGLRPGDEITGTARTEPPTEGAGQRGGGSRGALPKAARQYRPLIAVDTVNGMDPERARRRPAFYDLTPLYPQERLRLETGATDLTGRVIDLVMPLGKGQRALIVSQPMAGKTTVLKNIANAVTHNHPECHLMVVLIDERPEEVTDIQRSVKGEVIASTFDRPPTDHMGVAELAVERAKRLVERGQDVVILLDSITRLGRAYNLGAKAGGRTLSGGVDSTALYPPKRLLGAARNIEKGGSLTIIASALVDTGSAADTLIFEEFKSTGNAELKLDRRIAERRVFPAVDIEQSGTRKEEILLAPEELALVRKVRRALQHLDSTQAAEQLIEQLRRTGTNYQFLQHVARSAG